MWHSVLNIWRSASVQTRSQMPRRRSARLTLEHLEDRTVPSTFNAATVPDLIADIHAANQAGGSNTIALVAGKTFSLTAVDNTTDGATGLPIIAANDNLTIVGNGDTIARSTAAGTPAFRLLDVAGAASLTLQNLTLQGGLALGAGVSAEGGAIYNQGTLTLDGVTVQNNIAQGNNGAPGQAGQAAAGGGIYSSGSLTLEGSTKVQNNQALGGQGGTGYRTIFRFGRWVHPGGPGGNGIGGGLYVSNGTVSLTNVTLSSNSAQGGQGGPAGSGGLGGRGGNGFGGGLYAASGTIILRNDSVTGNTAQGAAGYGQGIGKGGGLYIDMPAAVSLDAFTQAHVSTILPPAATTISLKRPSCWPRAPASAWSRTVWPWATSKATAFSTSSPRTSTATP
jgi:hypothetical protein